MAKRLIARLSFRLKAITPLLATEKMRDDVQKQKRKKRDEKKELKFPPLAEKPQGPFKEPKKVYVQVTAVDESHQIQNFWKHLEITKINGF